MNSENHEVQMLTSPEYNFNGNGLKVVQPPISTVKPKLRLMKISELKPAPFQPDRRFEPERLARLKDEILRLGFIAQPITISEDGCIMDGHRRVRVAKSLGLVDVWCIVLPTGLSETFTSLNTSHENFNGHDWAVSVSRGLIVTDTKQKSGKYIVELQRIGGEELFAYLAENGIGVGIYQIAKMVSRKIGLDDDDGMLRIIHWFVRYSSQKRAREAIATEGIGELGKAIRLNLPLSRVNGEWKAG